MGAIDTPVPPPSPPPPPPPPPPSPPDTSTSISSEKDEIRVAKEKRASTRRSPTKSRDKEECHDVEVQCQAWESSAEFSPDTPVAQALSSTCSTEPSTPPSSCVLSQKQYEEDQIEEGRDGEEVAPQHQVTGECLLFDPRLLCTGRDLLEQNEIRSKECLLTYYESLQYGMHCALQASLTLSADLFTTNSSSPAEAMNFVSGLINTPIASVALSAAAKATDYLFTRQLVTAYGRLKTLNPAADPIQESLFVEMLARKMTIEFQYVLRSLSSVDNRQSSHVMPGKHDLNRWHALLAELVKDTFSLSRAKSPEHMASQHCQCVLQYIFAGKLQASPRETVEIINELVGVVRGSYGYSLLSLAEENPHQTGSTASSSPPKPPKPPRRPSANEVKISVVENPLKYDDGLPAGTSLEFNTAGCCVVS
eukprot:scaffold974_cov176-Ochromonas_danica.AAC.11